MLPSDLAIRVLACAVLVTAQFRSKPENTAASVDLGKASMSCAIDDGFDDTLEWYEYITDPNGTLIYDSETDTIHNSIYGVEKLSMGGWVEYELNLRHGSLTKEKGGTYGCGLKGGSVSKAEFVFIGGLNCTTKVQVEAGSYADIDASAEYSGLISSEIFVISHQVLNSNGEPNPTNDHTTLQDDSIYFSHTFSPAKADNGEEYTSVFKLKRPDTPPFSSDAVYTDDQCKTTVDVTYQPEAFVIYKDGSEISTAADVELHISEPVVIRCEADANPPANYTWTIDSSTAVSDSFTVTKDMVGANFSATCEASNSLGTARSGEVVFSVVDREGSNNASAFGTSIQPSIVMVISTLVIWLVMHA